MEAVEEALGSNSSEYSSCNGEFMQLAVVAKGRRTKRRRSHQRPVQSMVVAAADSSSASSAELSESITEEDEHMANCLILLAQGRTSDAAPKPESPDGGGGGVTEKFTSSRFAEAAAATTTGGKAGFDVYECKTCSKSFSSFQALGGHRASHKKPKLAPAPSSTVAEERKAMVHDEYTLQTSMNSLSTPVTGIDQSNGKAKIHECSICGSEFNSGQALGGHMRRHRPAVVVPEMQEGKKDRSLLSLDLNLPAPADDVVEPPRPPSPPPFAFAVNLSVVFPATASALVDCHY